jgi:ParB-like chromosome segregation protein Spo0J
MSEGEHIERDFVLADIGEGYGELRLVNPRVEKQMRASLERYGQMSPVVLVRDAGGRYELLDGFKRLRASRQLGWKHLRARVLQLGARAAKAAVLGLNWVTRSVSDLEEGWVVHALCRTDGLSQVEVGVLLGRDKSWVSRRLSLVERLCDEVQSQLRLGLISGTAGRELARLPRGNQARVLETVTQHGLGSREVSALVDLFREASAPEREPMLRSPREALAEAGKGAVVTRDPRLADAGNQLLRELSQMERGCMRVMSAVGIGGLSRLRRGDLLVLAPALGRAQRAGQQASRVLREALALAQGERDDDVEQP